MIISVALEKDSSTLKQIANEALRALDELSLTDKEIFIDHTSKNIESYLCGGHRLFLTGSMGDEIVGYILVKEYWNLSDLFVLPAYQRKGIGTRLLSEAISSCKLDGVGYVRLNSSASAQGFYEKHGFQHSASHTSQHDHVVPLELQF